MPDAWIFLKMSAPQALLSLPHQVGYARSPVAAIALKSVLFASVLVSASFAVSPSTDTNDEFTSKIRPFLEANCVKCHGGEKVKGEVDFTTINSPEDVDARFELWQTVVDMITFNEMPPEEEEKRPSESEVKLVEGWYSERFIKNMKARPGELKPRLLSASEFRNTLSSVLGFDLQVVHADANLNVVEPSLVMKLLPTDPPGKSGFVNDTHGVQLTSYVLEQYAYLANRGLYDLFLPRQRTSLEALIGSKLPENFVQEKFSFEQAEALFKNFAPRVYRRPVSEATISGHISGLRGLEGQALHEATVREMKKLLLTPSFIYRGILMEGLAGNEQPVDCYELAERLSYFLWEDAPDSALIEAAERGELAQRESLEAQIDRMLAAPKAQSLTMSFASQWLGLSGIDEIDANVFNKPAALIHSMKDSALDFINYLFTENRSVMELIESDVAFINNQTARFYPESRHRMSEYEERKGFDEVAEVNQRITLEASEARGGVLTMPGILRMNEGPIQRGTWMLERVLGEHLGDPPDDVPPIEATMADTSLSFRERFQLHRSNSACAVCHNRIDPLGFALQRYNKIGAYVSDTATTIEKPPREAESGDDASGPIDTSGKLPTGETFEDFDGLQRILMENKQYEIIRNAVERTLSYALCRKLEAFDQPTVAIITKKIDETNGSWRDLFVEVALSLPFQKTYIPEHPDS